MLKQINPLLETCRKAYLALLIVAATLTAFTVKAQGWHAARLTANSAMLWVTSTTPGRALQTDSQQVQAEVITITPRGFEPLEITRPAGKFLLVVESQVDLPELTLRLDREQGERLHEVLLKRERPEWSQVLDLPAGTYLMTEANHPDWACRLTVTSE